MARGRSGPAGRRPLASRRSPSASEPRSDRERRRRSEPGVGARPGRRAADAAWRARAAAHAGRDRGRGLARRAGHLVVGQRPAPRRAGRCGRAAGRRCGRCRPAPGAGCSGRRRGRRPGRTGTGSWPRRAGSARAAASGPRTRDDRDRSLLERLAQRLEDVPAELGQLVEEEHAVVGEAHLARPRDGPAAHEGGVARRVVRAAEGTRARASASSGSAGGRVDRRWSRAPPRGVSGGRMPGRRRASIVLPEPGGPTSSRLWPPAAAISRRAPGERPGRGRRPGRAPRARDGAGGTGRRGRARARRAASVDRLGQRADGVDVDARSRSRPPPALAAGTIAAGRPCRRAISIMGRTPLTGRTRAVEGQLADEQQRVERPTPVRAPSAARRPIAVARS